jgi:NIMA (never in mitosis gene a)-related kinase
LGEGTGNLAQYVIDKKIGQGQFSVVYRAKAVSDGLIVALKRIPVEFYIKLMHALDC